MPFSIPFCLKGGAFTKSKGKRKGGKIGGGGGGVGEWRKINKNLTLGYYKLGNSSRTWVQHSKALNAQKTPPIKQ